MAGGSSLREWLHRAELTAYELGLRPWEFVRLTPWELARMAEAQLYHDLGWQDFWGEMVAALLNASGNLRYPMTRQRLLGRPGRSAVQDELEARRKGEPPPEAEG